MDVSTKKKAIARVSMEAADAERIAQIKQVTPAYAVLSVEEAWRIATTWEMERPAPETSWMPYFPQGRIQLGRHTIPSTSPVKSYEWIYLEYTKSEEDPDVSSETRFRQLCGQLRGLCVTWTLLSRCRGFGAEENPVFWKHVLDREPEVHGVSDAVRFFQKNTFPAFKLWGRYGGNVADVLVRTIFGVEPTRDEAAMSTLDDITTRLLPLVDSSRMTEPVKIGFDPYSDFPVEFFNELSETTPTSTLDIPFVLGELEIDKEEEWGSLRRHPLMQSPPVSISLTHFEREIRNRSTLHSLLQIVLNFECSDAQGRSHAIRITRSTTTAYGANESLVTDQMVAAVCSGLPYARSVRSFQYEDSCTTRRNLTHDWAWLGYALFHPDTPHSTWRELALLVSDATEDLPFVLSVMSKGNNLLSILSGTPAESTSYYSTTLEPESLVFGNPQGIKSPRWKAKDLGPSFDAFVSSCDVSALNEWVTLIAPALGLVYTRRENIIDITSRPPSVPQLTAFDVRPESSCEQTSTVLPALLGLIGTSLEHLVIKSFPDLDSITFRRLLRRFPSLVSLAISNNGQLWSDEATEDDESSLPKLRELTLWLGENQTFVPFSHVAMKCSLRELQALNIDNWSPGSFSQSDLQDVVGSLRHLRYFTCVGDCDCRDTNSYTISREKTFRHLGFSPNDPIAYAYTKGDVDSRHALASIVSNKVFTSSTAGRLDRDTLGHVMGFATERYPREFYVSDWIEEQ